MPTAYQQDQKNNKLYVLLCIVLIAAIHIVPFIIGHPYKMIDKGVFWGVDAILIAGFSILAFIDIKDTQAGGADNGVEKFVWIVTLAIIAWVLIWNHGS